MPITWDYSLIALSVAVAIIGSFTALTHAQRMRASTSAVASRLWMLAGAATLGTAIWSMHFIGMLAFHLQTPISYDIYLTLLSMVPAIVATLIGFRVLRSPVIRTSHLIGAGILMGAAISAMHYTGMAALKMSPPISYQPEIFVLSLVIAVVAAWGALLLMYPGEQLHLKTPVRLLLGALVMGLAISGMHYTGMLAAQFQPGSVCLAGPSRIEPHLLANLVMVVSMLWFGGGIIAALFDHQISKLHQAAKNLALQMTQELRDSEEKTRAIIDAALDCIITVNQKGEIIEFNRAAELTFGYRDQQVMGRDMAKTLFSRDHHDHDYEDMADLLSTGDRRLEVTAIRANGNEFPAELTITRFIYKGETLLTCFIRDITDRKQAEDEIHNLAFFDPLTGLPNRRLMRDRLQHTLSSCTRMRCQGAILFIDLDNFKTLNDTRGHDIGDLLLTEVAVRLQLCIRSNDTVSRIGGDEFVVILQNLSADEHQAALEAGLIGDKICTTLSKPYLLNGFEHHSTCSIGIGLFHDTSLSADELLKRSDTAMYEAKRSGRNAVRFFDPSMQAELEERTLLEHDLRHALEHDQLVMYFQIQVDDAYRIVSAEVLLRWQHPQHGLILPCQFIPLAEETNLILPIGEWILKSACQLLKSWENDPLAQQLEIAVNVSARQFRQPAFVDQVSNILKESGANPSKLKLELTESLVLDNIEDSIRKMEALRTYGIRFSMDDFGTGQSSLTYLKRLPLSQLKIDQSFVRDIVQDANDAVIVQTIIGMAKNMGLAVIAEGVETPQQLAYLQSYGCPAFQGFLFGKPMPYEEFIRTLNVDRPLSTIEKMKTGRRPR